MFQPKGHMTIDAMVLQSAVGPLGQPADQAMYPGIATTDGKPMNAQHDYVIRMTKAELPPAIAFWSLTLYDTKEGFFIPNKENKYSVGANAGMKLNAKGGIDVYVAAAQPKGVPAENWLPITRGDLGIGLIMRVYQPDLKKMKTNINTSKLMKRVLNRLIVISFTAVFLPCLFIPTASFGADEHETGANPGCRAPDVDHQAWHYRGNDSELFESDRSRW